MSGKGLPDFARMLLIRLKDAMDDLFDVVLAVVDFIGFVVDEIVLPVILFAMSVVAIWTLVWIWRWVS